MVQRNGEALANCTELGKKCCKPERKCPTCLPSSNCPQLTLLSETFGKFAVDTTQATDVRTMKVPECTHNITNHSVITKTCIPTDLQHCPCWLTMAPIKGNSTICFTGLWQPCGVSWHTEGQQERWEISNGLSSNGRKMQQPSALHKPDAIIQRQQDRGSCGIHA